MTSQKSSQALRLKEEGNALFEKNHFAKAYKKYTEALEYDNENAILYSNRAACSLALKRYLDALSDATKVSAFKMRVSISSRRSSTRWATDIDPGYARAWGRLAAARIGLDRIVQAIDAWTRALDLLQKDNLTLVEQSQRDQYSSELAAAITKFERLKANPRRPEGLTTIRSSEYEKLPWRRAMTLIPELDASGTWNSSAWVILRAYTTWEEAMDALRQGHIQQTPAGPVYVGRFGVIARFTNALIEDVRVFHILDENFLSMYNRQVEHEVNLTKAWSGSSSKEVIQEAPKRLEAEGWECVRPSLSTTVRGWMMRGFFECSLKDNVETALDFYTSAVEVLKWGAEFWKDVPYEEKGNVFQPTIVRGAKCLRLDALLGAYKKNPGGFSQGELLTSADELLFELVDAPTQPPVPDPAFFLSFIRYPIGQAHAVRGFCLLENAKRSREDNGGTLTKDITLEYLNASAEYLRAASNYPQDDEKHAWLLHCAYHAQFDGGTTPRGLLLVLDMLEESLPMVKKIWELSHVRARQDGALVEDLRARERLQRALDAKQVELDSFVINPNPGMQV